MKEQVKRRSKRRKNRAAEAGIAAVLSAVVVIGGIYAFAGSESGRRRGKVPSLVMEYAQPEIDLSGLNSRAGFLVRLSDGQVIARQRQDEKIFPASLTKIMTCIIALETIDDLEAEISMPEDIFPPLYADNASMAGFLPGEHVKIMDLLYGIILPSGGECSAAAAEYAAGSQEAFVKLMNEKAQKLGMDNTHFENVTGLHDENHYTTVSDLAVLLEYALRNDTFEQIFSSKEHFVSPTDGHPEGLMLKSSMFILEQDWTVGRGEIRGGKTGYTDQSGLCLATEAMLGNEKYIAVTAGAEGNHSTEPYHVLDAFYLYDQVENLWQVTKDE